MKYAILLLGLLFSSAANADMWKWVDANGTSHYVDSNRPIYTWTDSTGRAHYGDRPGNANAVLVELVRISSSPSRNATNAASSSYGDAAAPSRDAMVAQNCTRANQILALYRNSQQLYRTNDAGEREVLSDAERQAMIVEAQEKTSYLCGQ
ncbi:MAG: DUF4124 domain-containing protein [Woeseiaceae bacterium]|nr:DUF4124 domain-containing protein [Woeseiaceae bacterium]